MSKLFGLAALLVCATVGMAQDCAAPQSSGNGSKQFTLPPADFGLSARATQSQVRPANLTELTKAEKDFQRFGPKLFTMDDALALSKVNGKPVVCWVSTSTDRVFADPKARAVSQQLGDTTIQAVMTDDTRDGLTAKGPRVQFSDSDYAPTAKAAFIPVSKLNTESGKKILEFVRGGK